MQRKNIRQVLPSTSHNYQIIMDSQNHINQNDKYKYRSTLKTQSSNIVKKYNHQQEYQHLEEYQYYHKSSSSSSSKYYHQLKLKPKNPPNISNHYKQLSQMNTINTINTTHVNHINKEIKRNIVYIDNNRNDIKIKNNSCNHHRHLQQADCKSLFSQPAMIASSCCYYQHYPKLHSQQQSEKIHRFHKNNCQIIFQFQNQKQNMNVQMKMKDRCQIVNNCACKCQCKNQIQGYHHYHQQPKQVQLKHHNHQNESNKKTLHFLKPKENKQPSYQHYQQNLMNQDDKPSLKYPHHNKSHNAQLKQGSHQKKHEHHNQNSNSNSQNFNNNLKLYSNRYQRYQKYQRKSSQNFADLLSEYSENTSSIQSKQKGKVIKGVDSNTNTNTKHNQNNKNQMVVNSNVKENSKHNSKSKKFYQKNKNQLKKAFNSQTNSIAKNKFRYHENQHQNEQFQNQSQHKGNLQLETNLSNISFKRSSYTNFDLKGQKNIQNFPRNQKNPKVDKNINKNTNKNINTTSNLNMKINNQALNSAHSNNNNKNTSKNPYISSKNKIQVQRSQSKCNSNSNRSKSIPRFNNLRPSIASKDIKLKDKKTTLKSNINPLNKKLRTQQVETQKQVQNISKRSLVKKGHQYQYHYTHNQNNNLQDKKSTIGIRTNTHNYGNAHNNLQNNLGGNMNKSNTKCIKAKNNLKIFPSSTANKNISNSNNQNDLLTFSRSSIKSTTSTLIKNKPFHQIQNNIELNSIKNNQHLLENHNPNYKYPHHNIKAQKTFNEAKKMLQKKEQKQHQELEMESSFKSQNRTIKTGAKRFYHLQQINKKRLSSNFTSSTLMNMSINQSYQQSMIVYQDVDQQNLPEHQLYCQEQVVSKKKQREAVKNDSKESGRQTKRSKNKGTTSQKINLNLSPDQEIALFQKKLKEISTNCQIETQCFKFSRQQQKMYLNKLLDNNYIQNNQIHLTWVKRAVLVDWMIQFLQQIGSNRQVLGKSVSILDLYFSSKKVKDIQLKQLQKIGASCMLIAAKLQENKISIHYLYEAIGQKYTVQDIEICQIHILNVLGYKVNPPTLNMWTNRLIKQWDVYLEDRLTLDIKQIIERENQISQISQISQKNHFYQYLYSKSKFKDSDPKAYQNFRSIMQYIDFSLLDIQTLQYQPCVLAASFIYITLLKILQIYSDSELYNQIPKSSAFLTPQNECSQIPIKQWFNNFFNQFLQLTFQMDLQDLLPTIQYAATFVILPLNNQIPIYATKHQNDKQLQYQQFCGLQTRNRAAMVYIQRRNRDVLLR